ncbi:MAG: lecithin retinol acyltransferase family protein [Methylococcaceae bacterium]
MLDIPTGSHLIAPNFGTLHHGLYTQDGQIIHLNNANTIEEIPLSFFSQGNNCHIKKYHSQFSQMEIIRRARSKLGVREYSPPFENCEHFVTWCVYGEPLDNRFYHNTICEEEIANTIIGETILSSMPQLRRNNSLLKETNSFSFLSNSPIIPAAIVGYGVYKFIEWLNED